MFPVLKPLAFANEGRRSPCFRLSWGRLICIGSLVVSMGAGMGIDNSDVPTGVRSGEGDCSRIATVEKGILWGKGDMSRSMSIESCAPGEEDDMGGVVTTPTLGQ